MLIPPVSASAGITHTERRHLLPIKHSSIVLNINRKMDTHSGSTPRRIYFIQFYSYFLSTLQLLRVKNTVKSTSFLTNHDLAQQSKQSLFKCKTHYKAIFFLIPHPIKGRDFLL